MDYKKIEKEASRAQMYDAVCSEAYKAKCGLEFTKDIPLSIAKPTMTITWYEGANEKSANIPIPFDYDTSKLIEFLGYLIDVSYHDVEISRCEIRDAVNERETPRS